MQAVVLCAGRGSRLGDLTKDKPKCMIEINGLPVIHHIYNNLTKSGYDDIILVTGYKEDKIKEYGKINFSNCRYITQEKLTGTADALSSISEDMLERNFLVLAGDTIFPYLGLMKLSILENSLMYTNHSENLYEFGTIDLDDGIIKRIHEKSTKPVSELVNISAYKVSKDILDYISKTPIHKSGERIITNTINIMIEDGYQFYGIYTSNWYHVTYPEDIERIEEELNEKED